jgi:hypothetical protein
LAQSSSHFGGSDPDHGVVGGVVVHAPAKHLYTDHSLAEAIDFARQGMFHGEAQELLASP